MWLDDITSDTAAEKRTGRRKLADGRTVQFKLDGRPVEYTPDGIKSLGKAGATMTVKVPVGFLAISDTYQFGPDKATSALDKAINVPDSDTGESE